MKTSKVHLRKVLYYLLYPEWSGFGHPGAI